MPAEATPSSGSENDPQWLTVMVSSLLLVSTLQHASEIPVGALTAGVLTGIAVYVLLWNSTAGDEIRCRHDSLRPILKVALLLGFVVGWVVAYNVLDNYPLLVTAPQLNTFGLSAVLVSAGILSVIRTV